VGGSGAGIRRFDSLAELESAEQLDFGPDGTALLQEYLEPEDGAIVRVEVLEGSYLYAIRIERDRADGRTYFYDVNATSNFVANAPAVLGFDPFPRFVDFILRVAKRGR
jgi:hypothetical protein